MYFSKLVTDAAGRFPMTILGWMLEEAVLFGWPNLELKNSQNVEILPICESWR